MVYVVYNITMQTISTKQIRTDLIGFLRRLQQGEKITVIHRSKPLVTLSNTNEPGKKTEQEFMPGSPEALSRSARLMEEHNKNRPVKLDPKKSIKDLYHEMLDEEYGLN